MRHHRSITTLMLAAAAAGIAGVAHAQVGVLPADSPQVAAALQASRQEKEKLTLDQQRYEEVTRVYSQLRQTPSDEPQEVVYGADDRRDQYQTTDPFYLALGQAVCVVVNASSLTNNGDGTYAVSNNRWTTQGGSPVCADEPFRNQFQIGFCSGFLVGTDLIATAGHCASTATTVAFIFDFNQNGPTWPSTTDEINPARIPADKVYFGTVMVNRAQSGELDHAVVRVDRPVTGRVPVPVRRTGEPALNDPLIVIGHGVVLPKKYDAGGVVKDPRVGGQYFTSNLDTYGGNSGSAVFNRTTGVVEGILVRGNSDFTTTGGCTRSRVCPDTGCPTFEEISKTAPFASFIPELGIQVSPAGGTLHLGAGGVITPASVVYTLSNPTSSSANYNVSFVSGGTFDLEITGGSASGSLAAGANTNVTVSVASSAGSLPAGNYTRSVQFQDTTNGVTSTRVHNLEIDTTGISVTPATNVAGSGPVGGPFSGSVTYTVASTRPTPVDVSVTSNQSWIGINGGTSDSFTLTGVGDSRTVTVNIDSSASALGAGIYSGTVTFANDSGGTGGATRTVGLEVGRRNYVSGDTPIVLPDLSTRTSTIYVDDSFCIGDADVAVDIPHTYIGDLIVELTSPAGTVIRLHNRTGGGADNLLRTYDQDAGLGTFLPDGPGTLNSLDNQNAEGAWTLTVTDAASSDSGSINGWTLRLAEQTPCLPAANNQSLTLQPTISQPVTMTGASFGGGALTYVVTTLPANGRLFDPNIGEITSVPTTVTAAPGDTCWYRPNLGFVGSDSFQFRVENGNGASPNATVSLTIGERTVAADFPLSSNPGWATMGQWAYGQPTGGGSNNLDPTSGFTGPNVYGYNLAGDYPNNLTPTQYLTTTAIDLTGYSNLVLEFRRWLGVESSTFDKATVDASANGSTWSNVWSHTATTAIRDTSWQALSYPLPAALNGSANARIRWGMGVTDGSVTYPGWNIDDVRITGVQAPANPCTADLNGDGSYDLVDFFEFFGAYDVQAPAADINGDGVVDLVDFFAFFNVFDTGVCTF